MTVSLYNCVTIESGMKREMRKCLGLSLMERMLAHLDEFHRTCRHQQVQQHKIFNMGCLATVQSSSTANNQEVTETPGCKSGHADGVYRQAFVDLTRDTSTDSNPSLAAGR